MAPVVEEVLPPASMVDKSLCADPVVKGRDTVVPETVKGMGDVMEQVAISVSFLDSSLLPFIRTLIAFNVTLRPGAYIATIAD